MGALKIEYYEKNITPFGGMQLLKDFMDKTDIIKDFFTVTGYSTVISLSINSYRS